VLTFWEITCYLIAKPNPQESIMKLNFKNPISVFKSSALKGIVCATLCLILLIVVFLSFKPISLENFFDLDKGIKVANGQLSLKELHLDFAFGFRLTIKDAHLLTKNSKRSASLGEVQVLLDSWDLLKAKVSPRTIILEDLSLSGSRNKKGFLIAGVPISSKKDKPSNPSPNKKPKFDIVELINNIELQDSELSPYLRSLKSIRINNSHLSFDDKVVNTKWDFSDFKIYLDYKDKTELTLLLDLAATRKQQTAPVSLKFQYNRTSSTAEIEAQADFKNLTILDDYIPAQASNLLEGATIAQLKTTLRKGNRFSPPIIQLDSQNGQLSLPSLFNQAIDFASIEAFATYEEDRLALKKFRLVDKTGLNIVAQAVLSSINKNPDVFLNIDISETNVDYLAKYLPAKIVPRLSAWLDNNLNQAKVSNGNFKLEGPIAELPFHSINNNSFFKASFDFTDLQINYWPSLPPGSVESGRFEMNRGIISIFGNNGKISEQSIPKVDVQIKDVLTPEAPIFIEIAGIADGPVDDVIKQTSILTKTISLPKEVKASQKSKVELRIPLIRNIEKFKYSIISDLSKLSAKIPDSGINFNAERAILNVTEEEFNFEANGIANDTKVKVTSKGSSKNLSTSHETDFDLVLEEKHLKTLLANPLIDISGKADVNIKLSSQTSDSPIKLSADLKNSSIKIPSANWEKEVGIEANLNANGLISTKVAGVKINHLSMEAPELKINGRALIAVKDFKNSVIDLDELVVARNNLSIDYVKDSLFVKGERLDFRNLKHFRSDDAVEQKKPEQEKLKESASKPFNLNFSVGKLLLPKGSFHNVEGEVNLLDSKPQKGFAKWKFPEKGEASIKLVPDNDEISLIIESDNAGKIIRYLDLSEHVFGGTLKANLNCSKHKGLNLKEFDGLMNVEDVWIKDSPVILETLSYLSLNHLYSGKEGALFDKITIPFNLNNSVWNFSKMKIVNPGLTFELTGTMNEQTHLVDIKGQVVPLDGLGKLTKKLPLIGKTLEKTKRLVTGAKISISGKREDPKVDLDWLSLDDS